MRRFASASSSLVTFVAAIALLMSALFPASAHAQSPSDQYLALRRMYPPRAGVTLAGVRQQGQLARGATLELEGKLLGVVSSTDEGANILIISTKTDGTLSLPMSRIPAWVQSGNSLRLLLVATGVGSGAETTPVPGSTPELQIVAVASASDIAAAEQRYREQNAAALAASSAAAAARNRQMMNATIGASAVSTSGSDAPAARRSSPSGNSAGAPLPAAGQSLSNIQAIAARGLSPDAQAVFPAYKAYIQRHNRRLSDGEVNRITGSLLAFSQHMDLDPRLVVALIIAESDFKPETTSHKGAMGLGQLMPDEAQRLKLTNPYDPVYNIYGAVWLLKERLNKYSGSTSYQNADMRHIILALASYNAGMGAVRRYKGVPPYRETQNYVKKIEKIYRQLCQSDAASPPKTTTNGPETR